MRYEEAIEKHQPLSPYELGLVAGIYLFAWQKDGVFYVGTTGALLGDGIDRAITEYRERAGTAEVERARERERALLIEYALWISPVWEKGNSDDEEAAALAVDAFSRGDDRDG
jgi:hypothetical protein